MDRYVGDQKKVLVDCDRTRNEAVALTNDNAACEGKRTVEPARQDHAAVALGVKTEVVAAGLGFIYGLEREGGRIRMACSNTESGRGDLRHTEGDDRRKIAGDVVALSGFKLPVVSVVQIGEAFCIKSL